MNIRVKQFLSIAILLTVLAAVFFFIFLPQVKCNVGKTKCTYEIEANQLNYR